MAEKSDESPLSTVIGNHPFVTAGTSPTTGSTLLVHLVVGLVSIVSIILPIADTSGMKGKLEEMAAKTCKKAYTGTVAATGTITPAPNSSNNISATDVAHTSVSHIHGFTPGSPVPGTPTK